jgi:hypothetical protein
VARSWKIVEENYVASTNLTLATIINQLENINLEDGTQKLLLLPGDAMWFTDFD